MSIESIILNQEILRISSQLNREVKRFDRGFFLDTPFIAESPAMLDVLDLVQLVSKSPVNVLIQGEHGTGKELIARMIHEASTRRERSFVAINCAAIPENLMESEFFGYEKGAFTGADRLKPGRFEEAKGGSLLLDEIAELPLAIQPKFLRAIQEGEGTRLGGNKIISYDLRLISATNKDLKAEVEAGRFREDLFFRLFSVEIRIPPLRKRREDIVPLAIHFHKEISKRFGKKVGGFSPEVLNLLESYHWPGNVRQLRREVERMVALTGENGQITVDKCSRDVLTAAGNPNCWVLPGKDCTRNSNGINSLLHKG
ncbi:MAG: sigma-54 dependent transcriptional regulator [Deltaproteobacteria bacterium]